MPLGAVPESSARFVVRDGTPVVTCWNQPLADRFDLDDGETALRGVVSAVTADSAAVCTSIAAGDSAWVAVGRPGVRAAILRVRARDDGD